MVYELLSHGIENAIPSNQLVKALGLNDSRSLRLAVSRERADGVVILSTRKGRGGYFLPDSGEKGQQEIRAFCKTLTSHAVSTLRAISSSRQELSNNPEQISLFGGEESANI